jgi:hypothetical protein
MTPRVAIAATPLELPGNSVTEDFVGASTG